MLLKEASRLACLTSIIYQADQILRKYITKVIAEAKGLLRNSLKYIMCTHGVAFTCSHLKWHDEACMDGVPHTCRMRSGNLAGSNWAVKENEGQKRDGEKIGLFLLDCLPFLFLFLFCFFANYHEIFNSEDHCKISSILRSCKEA